MTPGNARQPRAGPGGRIPDRWREPARRRAFAIACAARLTPPARARRLPALFRLEVPWRLMLYIALIVIYVFICFFLILVVLLQQGKGADIAGAFGGGGSQTAFGARGATTLPAQADDRRLRRIHRARARLLSISKRGRVVGRQDASGEGGRERAGSSRQQPAGAPARRGPGRRASLRRARRRRPLRRSPREIVPPCRRGGIGRHVRLRGVWGNPCRFESGRRHHPMQL